MSSLVQRILRRDREFNEQTFPAPRGEGDERIKGALRANHEGAPSAESKLLMYVETRGADVEDDDDRRLEAADEETEGEEEEEEERTASRISSSSGGRGEWWWWHADAGGSNNKDKDAKSSNQRTHIERTKRL